MTKVKEYYFLNARETDHGLLRTISNQIFYKKKVVFKYYIIIMVIKANVCCMHTCGPGAMPLNALWFYGI